MCGNSGNAGGGKINIFVFIVFVSHTHTHTFFFNLLMMRHSQQKVTRLSIQKKTICRGKQFNKKKHAESLKKNHLCNNNNNNGNEMKLERIMMVHTFIHVHTYVHSATCCIKHQQFQKKKLPGSLIW